MSPRAAFRWPALVLPLVIVGLLCAQKTRPPEVEENPSPPAKSDRPPEVEEDPNKKRDIRVDDNTPAPARPAREPELVFDLGRAAKEATHPGVKELYRSLAQPIDLVRIGGAFGRVEQVEPIGVFVPHGTASKGKVELRTLTAEGKPGKRYEMALGENASVDYYENLALEQVEKFRATRWENNLQNSPAYLSVSDQLLATEQALAAVLRFHESARKSGQRQGDGWDPIQEALRKKLLAVVLERLQAVVEKGDFDEAFALAQQLAQRFPSLDDQRRIAGPLGKLVEQALAGGVNEEEKHKEVQRRLKAIADQFPFSDTTEAVSKGLRDQADKLVTQARQLQAQKDFKGAARLIQQAEEIDPTFPGIKSMRIQLAGQFPILRVGVPRLPEHLSPALAWTEAETQAVELLFESLVQLTPEPDAGAYVGQLAPQRPRQLPLGREFSLPRGLYWSNGKPLTGLDVRDTVAALRDQWGGRNDVWATDLIEGAAVGGDRHRVRITLRQGYLEPLALMNFKILPPLRQPDDDRFARNPVGSGPYVYDGKQSQNGRSCVVFKANPYYSNRPGAGALPRIREIQFFETIDPVADLQKNQIDLLLDVPAETAAAVRNIPRVEVSPPLPMRRVYFLAVNHRNPILANASFRRALAHAIEREKLLGHFRSADADKLHHVVNGPYPHDSWAANPRLKADLFDAALAKTQLDLAEKAQAGSKNARLTLKYPQGDARVEAAMKSLAGQLQATLEIKVEAEGLDARQLFQDVRLRHNYDLAYWHHDHADQLFDVWPLFDPRGKGEGGPNYLGYEPRAEVATLYRKAQGHRHFAEVRDTLHTAHELLYHQEMPLVPLWQLDRQIAVHARLKLYQGETPVTLERDRAVPLDPLRLFHGAEHWKLEP